MTEERNILVCMRLDDAKAIIYPGSVEGRCNACHAEVWVAPSGQEGIAAGLITETICISCAAVRFQEGQPQSVRILAKTVIEVRQWLNRN